MAWILLEKRRAVGPKRDWSGPHFASFQGNALTVYTVKSPSQPRRAIHTRQDSTQWFSVEKNPNVTKNQHCTFAIRFGLSASGDSKSKKALLATYKPPPTINRIILVANSEHDKISWLSALSAVQLESFKGTSSEHAEQKPQKNDSDHEPASAERTQTSANNTKQEETGGDTSTSPQPEETNCYELHKTAHYSSETSADSDDECRLRPEVPGKFRVVHEGILLASPIQKLPSASDLSPSASCGCPSPPGLGASQSVDGHHRALPLLREQYVRLLSNGSLECFDVKKVSSTGLIHAQVFAEERPVPAGAEVEAKLGTTATLIVSGGTGVEKPPSLHSVKRSLWLRKREEPVCTDTITIGLPSEIVRKAVARRIAAYSDWCAQNTESIRKEAESSSKIIAKGWLLKKGPRAYSRWKLRFFVLFSSQELVYHESEHTGFTKGTILLRNLDSSKVKVQSSGRDSPGSTMITIETSKRSWHLCSTHKTKKDNEEWAKVIRNACAAKNLPSKETGNLSEEVEDELPADVSTGGAKVSVKTCPTLNNLAEEVKLVRQELEKDRETGSSEGTEPGSDEESEQREVEEEEMIGDENTNCTTVEGPASARSDTDDSDSSSASGCDHVVLALPSKSKQEKEESGQSSNTMESIVPEDANGCLEEPKHIDESGNDQMKKGKAERGNMCSTKSHDAASVDPTHLKVKKTASFSAGYGERESGSQERTSSVQGAKKLGSKYSSRHLSSGSLLSPPSKNRVVGRTQWQLISGNLPIECLSMSPYSAKVIAEQITGVPTPRRSIKGTFKFE